MTTVLDVAAYILASRGEMRAWKLQKLVITPKLGRLFGNSGPCSLKESRPGRMAPFHRIYMRRIEGLLKSSKYAAATPIDLMR